MSKIAIPTTPTIFPFIEKAVKALEASGFTIVYGTEAEVEDLLHRNYVDLAFTTPMGYGRGVTVVDYRIVPTFALSLKGYTNIAGISFFPSAMHLNTITASSIKEFILTLGKHLIEERYDCTLTETTNENADVQVRWVNEQFPTPTLDIGEEWEEMYSEILPIGFWVCRPDKMPENIPEILNAVYSNEEQVIEIVEQLPENAEHFAREGAIVRTFDETFVVGLEKVLEMLYYAQVVPEIPAVKFYDGTINPIQE